MGLRGFREGKGPLGERKRGAYEARKRQLEQEQVCAALVAADFSQGERAGFVAAGAARGGGCAAAGGGGGIFGSRGAGWEGGSACIDWK